MSRTINFSIDGGENLIMRDKVNAAKIIGSTIKVWLNNDTPYEFNYENREKAKEDFAKFKKYLIEEDVEYIHKDAFIEKACEWLRKGGSGWYLYSESGEEDIDFVKLAEDFRKAMEDKQ